MDSLTHIAVGACIGELVGGKRLGKKAMVLGAIAQSIPDIDFVASYWMSVGADLLAHRGFTHSILFAVLAACVMGVVSQPFLKPAVYNTKRCIIFWGIQLCMHLFLDIFNVYGTALFEPFSHYRVSLNTFFVLDPLFSIWPVVGLVLLTLMRKTALKRRIVASVALAVSLVYMLVSVGNKLIIDSAVQKSMTVNNLKGARYFSTPTPLNNLLWYVVVQTDTGFLAGYHSVLDKTDAIVFHYIPQNDQLLTHYDSSKEVQRLKRFSQGFYSAQYYHDTLVFNDLRFGEMTAGLLPAPRCCFYYYLSPPAPNDVIIQRGRFAGWNKEVISMFLDRIKGQ